MFALSIRTLRTAALSALAVFAPVIAQADTILPQVKSALPILTIGDFFSEAGVVGNTPIFRAPGLGRTGQISAHVVTAAARAAGYLAAQPGDVETVSVTRMAIEVDEEIVVDALSHAIRERLSIPADHGLTVQLTRPFPRQFADASDARPFEVTALRLVPNNPAFEAIFEIAGDNGRYRVQLSGQATETVNAVIARSPMRQGDVITADDVMTTELPRNRAPRAIAQMEDLVGMELARSVGRGTALEPRDIRNPTLVRRGENVMITYRRANLVLSVVGEALTSGARGDTVRILNRQSNRTLEARVVEAGTVEVGPQVTQLARVEQ